ncbi:hypothetical protein H0H81_001600 [Sphagnurus paluster]|uniref:DM2 domain-containing protein n=1 Tax=Sphagnurus paluster TaxID=117069 RepID=A0A9P7K712_9AGAR|nr:hypothetical protein H0H81_001600 [Sphagnurus paluster]
MAFDFSTLEGPIYKILSAPGTDLTTISAKRVRRQLLKDVPSITPEFMKDNKEEIDLIIGKVFESVNTRQGTGESNEGEEYDETEVPERSESRKRKQEDDEEGNGEEEVEDDEREDSIPPPKKAKKLPKGELSDAELARQLSDELNGRSRRTPAKPRGNPSGGSKKGTRAKKSAATVDSDDDSVEDGEQKRAKPKKRSNPSAGGAAKGGFAKEYALSEPLAALLKIDKLSRPQVVKQLWVYIKDNELQNPSNKREIMCDGRFRAVFGVDKIDMFKMNKVLGQYVAYI